MPNTYEINNVFKVDTAFPLTSNSVTHSIIPGLYGIILSPDGSHAALVPVETVETTPGVFMNIADDLATNHYSNIDPADIASNSASFAVDVSVPPSHFPQNILNVGVPTDFTSSSGSINIASEIMLFT